MFVLLYSAVVAVIAAFIVRYAIQYRWRKREEFKKREKSNYARQGTRWNAGQSEYYVERFYETGLTGRHDFHGGYLNFGFWVDGNTDYVKASQALLSQVADPVRLGEDSRLLYETNGKGSQDSFYYNGY